jgi:hypothetical protein
MRIPIHYLGLETDLVRTMAGTQGLWCFYVYKPWRMATSDLASYDASGKFETVG